MPKKSTAPLLGPGLVSRRLTVDAPSAMLVKAIVEAHEGIASVFGEEGGALTLASPVDREADLDALLDDVRTCLARVQRSRS